MLYLEDWIKKTIFAHLKLYICIPGKFAGII